MAMDPELLGGAGASDPAPSADPAPSDNPGDQDETDGGGDKSPLEKMETPKRRLALRTWITSRCGLRSMS
jgi:hypothetical protein